MSENPTDPIRVCLLVDGNSIAQWHHVAVERMLDETDAEVSLVVRSRADQRRSPLELLQRAIELREWTVVTLVRKAIASGSSPSSRLRKPFTRVCEEGASRIAATAEGQLSTSPQPTIPASVSIRRDRPSSRRRGGSRTPVRVRRPGR